MSNYIQSFKLNEYYLILKVDVDSTEQEIYNSYKNHIAQFNNLPFLTTQMVSDIKLLKEAIYVLGNVNKRKKYNIKLKQMKTYTNENNVVDNTKICDRVFSITFN